MRGPDNLRSRTGGGPVSVRSRAKHRIRRKKPRPSLYCACGPGSPWPAPATDCCSGRCPSWPWSSTPIRWPSPASWPRTACRGSSWRCPAGAFADRFARGPLMAISNVLRAARHRGRRVPDSERPDDAGPPDRGRARSTPAGGRSYYSSLQAIVPELVPSDALEHANGVLSGTEAGPSSLAGPVVGTWLFAMNKAIPFFADAVVTVLSCIPLVGLPLEGARNPRGPRTPTWEGVRLLFADRRLRLLLLMVASLAGLQGMEAGILVLLATTEWGVREGAYGLFLAAGAAGNLIGSLWANRLVRRFGSGQTLIGAALVSGVGYLVMAGAHGWQLAGAGLRPGRSRRRRRVRRRHLALGSGSLLPKTDGTGRRRLARHRLGRRPRGRTGGREPGDPRRTPVAIGAGRGAAVCGGGAAWPGRSSTASGGAASPSAEARRGAPNQRTLPSLRPTAKTPRPR